MAETFRPRINSMVTKMPPDKPPRRSTVSTFSNLPKIKNTRKVVRTPSQLYHYLKPSVGTNAVNPKILIKGPEFIVRSKDEPIVINLGDTCAKKDKNVKKITIVLLNGKRVELTCDFSATTVEDVFKAVIHVIPSELAHLFGLAMLIKGEFHFLTPKLKVSKIAPMSWKTSKSNLDQAPQCEKINLFLQFACYPDLDGVHLLNEDALNLVYLQLRHDFLEGRVFFPRVDMIILASLALQAEFGRASSMESPYFLLDHFLPPYFIEENARLTNELTEDLCSRHQSIKMPPITAKRAFVMKFRDSNSYGLRIYRCLLTTSDKKVWLALNYRGVKVLSVAPSLESLIRATFAPWKLMEKCSCSSLKLDVSFKLDGKAIRYQLTVAERPRFVMHLIEMHKYFHKKNPRILRVSKKSSFHKMFHSRSHSFLRTVDEPSEISPEMKFNLSDDQERALGGLMLEKCTLDRGCGVNSFPDKYDRKQTSFPRVPSNQRTNARLISRSLSESSFIATPNKLVFNDDPFSNVQNNLNDRHRHRHHYMGLAETPYFDSTPILLPQSSRPDTKSQNLQRFKGSFSKLIKTISPRLSNYKECHSEMPTTTETTPRHDTSISDESLLFSLENGIANSLEDMSANDGNMTQPNRMPQRCDFSLPDKPNGDQGVETPSPSSVKSFHTSLSSVDQSPFSSPKKAFTGVKMGTRVTSARLQKHKLRLMDSPNETKSDLNSSFSVIVMEPSDGDRSPQFEDSVSDSLLSRFLGASEDSLERRLVSVTLKKNNGSLGLLLGQGSDGGLYIMGLSPGSPANEEGTLKTGDRLVGVDGLSVENVSYGRAVGLLRGPSDEVTLLVSQALQTKSSILSNSDEAPACATPPMRPVIDKRHVTVITVGTEGLMQHSSQQIPP